MTILVTGASGMLGREVVERLVNLGVDVHATSHSDFDITDPKAIAREIVPGVKAVINCAAYTNVDGAEDDQEAAHLLNSIAPGSLAVACGSIGAKFVHISTDYVFPGDATSPYAENAPTGPKSVYGKTKLDGERLVLALAPENSWIVRTSWLYGAGGPNFVSTMLRIAGEREVVNVVNDQKGSPTWAGELAIGLVDLVTSENGQVVPGVYHCTNDGAATWFEFAQTIFAQAGLDPARIQPVTSAEFVRPAPRPHYSVLSNEKWLRAGLPLMSTWQDALVRSGLAQSH